MPESQEEVAFGSAECVKEGLPDRSRGAYAVESFSAGVRLGFGFVPFRLRFSVLLYFPLISVESGMFFGIAYRCRRSLPVACLLVLSGVVLCAEAEGGCGDYLTDRVGREMGMGEHAQNGMTDAEGDQPARAPCQGPSCRNRREMPASPTAPRVSLVQEDWACSGEAIQPEVIRQRTGAPGEGAPLVGRGAVLGIFRPPRESERCSSP